MAMAVKPGAFANIRNAYFKSVNINFIGLFRAQRLDRIDQRRSPGRQQTRDQRGHGK